MTDTQATLPHDLSTLLARELDTLIREVELLPDEASLWKTMTGVSNSCGTLALHCAGNLQHYVGAVLGGSGYVRDRAREFSQRTGTRAEVAAELRRARQAVSETLAALPVAVLDAEFPEAVGGVKLPTRLFLLHLAVHLGFHVGQADYLRRVLCEDARTADTVSVKRLVPAV
jgi:uncharacterized damage-inducible protein DinB